IKISIYFVLFSIFICNSQTWKTYPYTPNGSLIYFSKDEGQHISENITWTLDNPDDGNPLLYDISYSIDNKQSFKIISEGITETSFYWENPEIQSGENIWFKITAYSKDKTLINSAITNISSSFVLPVDEFENKNIVLFPNPSDDILKINFNQYIPLINYQIIDINGKILLDKEVRNEEKLIIDIKKYEAGLYFLNITHSNKSMYTKFIIE
ncbi:MAG: T9SS type A sorting domain-containing protein, partial [Bacteroidota bacterium]